MRVLGRKKRAETNNVDLVDGVAERFITFG